VVLGIEPSREDPQVKLEERHIPKMCKSQLRNKRYVKKQGNMTPPKVHNSLITESKDTKMVKCQRI
jgi:hypothetical protein